MLFFFRWSQLEFYTVSEFSFAMAVAWYALGGTLSKQAAFAGMMGSVYVLIRSADNWKKGWLERKAQSSGVRATSPVPGAS